MDYQEQENKIIEYISNNFNKYNTNVKIDHYINEFLDFDLYNYDESLWFSFENYSYEDLTNESKLQTNGLKIYIVARNDTEKNLHKKTRDYATAFYNMFGDSNLNFKGIIDTGIITDVHFFDAVEADKSKKLVEIDLTLLKEI
jgi:hypothetical protein